MRRSVPTRFVRPLLAATFLSLAAPAVAHAALYDADGVRIDPQDEDAVERAWEVLHNADGSNDRLRAVGWLDRTTCTGTLIAPHRATDAEVGADPTAPAYVLTAGHCASTVLPDPNEIIVDAPDKGLVFTLDAFADTTPRPVEVARISYSTMRSVDLAILELDITLQELIEEGYTPLPIGAAPDLDDDALEMVGRPTDGIDGERVLRRSECLGGGVVDMVEGQFHWENAFTHHCSTVGGSSGSPVLHDGVIVGVTHTTDTGGSATPECFMQRPCETGPKGDRLRSEENYANRLDPLLGCWDEVGRFAPEGCDLLLDAGPLVDERLERLDNRVTPELEIVGDGVAEYRAAVGDATLDCEDPRGYGEAHPIDEPLQLDLTGFEDGRISLCLRGRSLASAEASEAEGDPELGWTRVQDATRITWHLDTVAPVAAFKESFEDLVFLDFDFAGGQRVLYRLKQGAASDVDCTDPEGYRIHFQLSDFVSIQHIPFVSVKLCALAEDLAGNVQAAEDATELILSLDDAPDDEAKHDAVDAGLDDDGGAGCRMGVPTSGAPWVLLVVLLWMRRRTARGTTRAPSRG